VSPLRETVNAAGLAPDSSAAASLAAIVTEAAGPVGVTSYTSTRATPVVLPTPDTWIV
jgi:hypothetical protein